ncbi:phosphoribosylglycinamide formyltransferase [Mesobacillus campisalis]|uniref:Phosphoribosylglycinamide formyltransferase n=1 Tax=Mesobacillus campisalis TaxID=1408103 RepID=A0A0M2SNF7_9BACI|nr:phosphoribosylglycinamide formyltransferase [Mesobacillus campisalis]KKK34195.1 phosphoribosylglycinamide formyltransferase [Mesobacillus campisalis]
MKKVAVFASGNGSNFQAILDAVEAGTLKAEISLLVCDRPGAFAVERAARAAVPFFIFNTKDFMDKAAYEMLILEQLKKLEIDFIVLAGYMRLIGPTLLKAYEGRIINIHPSLLPAFPGKDAIGQAFAARVAKTGVTVHYVDSGMDTGEVIAQRSVDIEPGETKESLQAKIQRVEHELYPAVVERLLNGQKEAAL